MTVTSIIPYIVHTITTINKAVTVNSRTWAANAICAVCVAKHMPFLVIIQRNLRETNYCVFSSI